MSTAHLSGEELDLVLLGEGLPLERAEHLAGCLVCRRRREDVLAAIAGAARPDPGAQARVRVRRAALAAATPRYVPVRWLAAAAALLLVALAAIFVARAPRPQPVDTEAVLREVDEVLARDPLSAFAGEDVVEVVVADTDAEQEAPPAS